MTVACDTWDTLAALLDYPADDSYVSQVRACAIELETVDPAAAARLQRLHDALATRSLAAVQEEYVSVFDFDPSTALDIGWHLFGDGPDRGPWLATLAGALERAGVPRRDELPDHLAHVLMLIAREPDARADSLIDQVTPTVETIQQRLEERGSSFAELVGAAASLLKARNLARGQP